MCIQKYIKCELASLVSLYSSIHLKMSHLLGLFLLYQYQQGRVILLRKERIGHEKVGLLIQNKPYQNEIELAGMPVF